MRVRDGLPLISAGFGCRNRSLLEIDDRLRVRVSGIARGLNLVRRFWGRWSGPVRRIGDGTDVGLSGSELGADER